MAEASPTTTPEPFTAANDAGMTLQAQHTLANDHPTDVNNNAALGRLQAQCTARIGEEFAAAASRRTILADKGLGG